MTKQNRRKSAAHGKQAKAAKQPTAKAFLKRRTFEQGKKLADDAHAATWWLYCEVLAFWRTCRLKPCKRHRRCCGEPASCLMRGLPGVTAAARTAAGKAVIAGGPRCIKPASHMEYVVRRQPLAMLTTWRPGASAKG
jgi:hypothetical protein